MMMPQSRLIEPRHEHRLLGGLLLSFYLASWPELSGWLGRALLLGHFLLFILWQPLWQESAWLHWRNHLILLAFMAVLVGLFDAWLLPAWSLALLALLSGRDWGRFNDRLVNWLGVVFVILALFLVQIPTLFHIPLLDDPGDLLLRYGLLAIPLGFLLVTVETRADNRYQMDFFHGLAAGLLTAAVAAGSLLLSLHFGARYLYAALLLSGLGLLLVLLLSWLWVGFGGFSKIEELWSRQWLTLGNSFEQWLASLTQPGYYKQMTAEQFLTSGLEQLAALPWVRGVAWKSPYGEGRWGENGRHEVMVSTQSIEVTVYSAQRIGGQQYAHIKLLVQLLEHFHQAKRREQEYSQQARLQAIHETGAKLTHEIKNVLQALYAIASNLESKLPDPDKFGETIEFQAQLPILTQRLKRIVDKLNEPTPMTSTMAPIRTWWDSLAARYRKREVDFSMNISWNAVVPQDLFNNVVENLLENALKKRQREPGLRIHVALSTSENQVRVSVCDDGSAIPPEIEKQLLTQPVPSRDGFGIGLYQVAKQTIHSGYRLSVSHNESGQVCFELASI